MTTFTTQDQVADTGFHPDYSAVETTSHIGPIVMGFFAFFILAQGLIYIIKPEMTGRSVEAGEAKIRRIGFFITLGAAFVLYLAFSWWVDQSTSVDHAGRKP